MRRNICVICARSGSKGVPNKNIHTYLGKPLLAYSVETAISSKVFEHIVVTSDSSEYLEIAAKYGADILVQRPTNLSLDTVTKLGAIEHAVTSSEKQLDINFDTIVDLDVTSPLRIIDDVIGALDLFNKKNCTSVITGCKSHRSPYTNLVEVGPAGYVWLSKPTKEQKSRRQESPPCFDMNASIYIWKRDVFRADPRVFYSDTLLYEMPFERSWDIDSEIDFEIVECLMSRRPAS